MTTKQLRAELMETRAKIRTANEELKVQRTRYTELKARLNKARANRDVNGGAP